MVGRAIQNVQTEETWSAGSEANTFVSSALGGTPVFKQLILWFKDVNGDFAPLVKLGTEVEVSTTPGSWTIIGSGGGQQAVIRLFDDGTPDND